MRAGRGIGIGPEIGTGTTTVLTPESLRDLGTSPFPAILRQVLSLTRDRARHLREREEVVGTGCDLHFGFRFGLGVSAGVKIPQ